MSDSPSGQTRTPPALKWLLNERAAVAGQVQASAIRYQLWAAKISELQARLDAYDMSYQKVMNLKVAQQGALDALDVAIGLAYQNVRPNAAGTVNAWAGKYGKRGALTEFVAATFRDALPAGVDVSSLINLASKHFCISVRQAHDRTSLMKSVKSAVANLVREGQVIQGYKPMNASASVTWRWKQPTTLAELGAKASAMRELSSDAELGERKGYPGCPPGTSVSAADPNTPGCEVAAQ